MPTLMPVYSPLPFRAVLSGLRAVFSRGYESRARDSVLAWLKGDQSGREVVLTDSGTTVYKRADIEMGRQVWQSIGGQQLGSIWGHGALVAPDWSADWLHREALAWLDLHSRQRSGIAYADLNPGEQARAQAELRPLIRTNTFDASSNQIVIPAQRAQAIAQVAAHYASLFSSDPATRALRVSYAMREDTIPDAQHRRAIAAFFFWTSWAAVTQRPGETMTYTQNWPYEPLVGNVVWDRYRQDAERFWFAG